MMRSTGCFDGVLVEDEEFGMIGGRVVRDSEGRARVSRLRKAAKNVEQGVSFDIRDNLREDLLDKLGVHPTTANVFRRLKSVGVLEDGGRKKLVIQPNVGKFPDEHDLLPDPSEMYEHENVVKDDRELKYQLSAVFRDAPVADKLCIPRNLLNSARKVALTDPLFAASMLTERIRMSGFPNAVVLAGDYAKSRLQARSAIVQATAPYLTTDLNAEGVVRGKIFTMRFDNFGTTRPIWQVQGPLEYAREVSGLYQMAVKRGPQVVITMWGMETMRLDIDFLNLETDEYYAGVVYGCTDMRGIVRGGFGLPSGLTAEQAVALTGASVKIGPVVVSSPGADDLVVGSSVQVSDTVHVTSQHTVDELSKRETVGKVAGQPVIEATGVGLDMVAVTRSPSPASWQLRSAKFNERVVVCYSVGNGEVEYSEVLHVNVVDGSEIILGHSQILRPGCSGGAVIALSDGALLGIFSRKVRKMNICVAVDTGVFSRAEVWHATWSEPSVCEDDVDSGVTVYNDMVKRGLKGYLVDLLDASSPLLCQGVGGKQVVGTAVAYGGHWVTTYDARGVLTTLQDNVPLAFVTSGSAYRSTASVAKALPLVREPKIGERVSVFVRVDDDFGVSMTASRLVKACNFETGRFFIDAVGDEGDVPVGGLIVSLEDASVLGQFVRDQDDGNGLCVVMGAGLHDPVADDFMSSVVTRVGAVMSNSAGRGRARSLESAVKSLVVEQMALVSGVDVAGVRHSVFGAWEQVRDEVLVDVGWREVVKRLCDPLLEGLDADAAAISFVFLASPQKLTAKFGEAVTLATRVSGLRTGEREQSLTPTRDRFSVDSDRSRSTVEDLIGLLTRDDPMAGGRDVG